VENRNTIQKVWVLQAAQALDHPSAEDIYRTIAKTYPGISRGTVYRNLHVLVESGSLRQIRIPNGPDRFDKTLRRHYHGVCRNCGAVVDTNLPQAAPWRTDGADQLPESLVLDSGFVADDHSIVFWGLCADCRDKRPAAVERRA
jgi:Fe2+ or Zn2+ uptake regulation protein